MQTSDSRVDETMPRGFGLLTAVWVVVASMVGVGVLVTSGYTVKNVGGNQPMLWLWVLGAVYALAGALTIAELGAMLPKSGGDYVFLYESYGPLAGFLSGWVSFLIGFGGPIAISATAAADYLLTSVYELGDVPSVAKKALASGFIAAFAVIHSLGRTTSARVQGAATIIKVALLSVLAIAGIYAGRGGGANLADVPPITFDFLRNMLFSMVYISYAYTGWNAAGYIGGEVKDPHRTLPRAILLGTAGVAVLYLALNLFYALALRASLVIAAKDVEHIASMAAAQVFGERTAKPLSIAVGLMLLSTASAYILTGPRILHAMAERKQFPAFAGKLTKTTQTPARATFIQCAWSIVILWLVDLQGLLTYAGVGLAIFSMLTVSSVYVLRIKHPEWHRPFKTPGYPVTPAFFLVISALLTAAAFSKARTPSLYACAAILIGVPVYYLAPGLRRPKAPAA